jgi:hypothetical protein
MNCPYDKSNRSFAIHAPFAQRGSSCLRFFNDALDFCDRLSSFPTRGARQGVGDYLTPGRPRCCRGETSCPQEELSSQRQFLPTDEQTSRSFAIRKDLINCQSSQWVPRPSKNVRRRNGFRLSNPSIQGRKIKCH